MANFEWPPLESNPEIFTTYLRQIGLPSDWGICEVYGLDDDLLAFVPQPTRKPPSCKFPMFKCDCNKLE